MDPIISQLSISAIIVQLIEGLKNSKTISWINHESTWTNRAVALLFAAMSGLGLGYMYDSTAGVFTITGLQFSHIFNTLWTTATSYGTQYLIYKGVIRKGDPGQVPAVVAVGTQGETIPESK